jgi:predicted transcriptional regulator
MKHYEALPEFTEHQSQLIVGSLLGDANLSTAQESWNWRFEKRQSKLDKCGVDKISYMQWHDRTLSEWGLGVKESVFKNKNKFKENTTLKKDEYQYYQFSTHAHPIITKLAKKWYKTENGVWVKNDLGRIIKIISNDIILTPLSLCVWLMDDGFCYPKDANAILCTHGFTFEEVDFLVDRLKVDLDIKSTRRTEWRGYPIIYIGRKSYFDMIEMVRPHVDWDCFNYKIDTTTYNKKPHRGETHSLAKITEEKALLAFRLRSEKKSQKEIAIEIGVSAAAVSMLLSGDRWKHLGMKFEVRRKPRIGKDTIYKIIEMGKQGASQPQIATTLDVSNATVSRTLKRWRDATN